MDRKTSLAVVFTASVAAVTIVWTLRGNPHRRIAQNSQHLELSFPEHDPMFEPPRPWPAMESKVRLDIDSSLAAPTLRIGTSRWDSARSRSKLDYERVEYREASLHLREDGSLSLFVVGRTIGDAEWYEFPIPPSAVCGQRLDGEACFFMDIGPPFHTYPAWMDGKLTLSSLPRAVGETVNFDLSLQLASGWQFHACGPLKAKAATN